MSQTSYYKPTVKLSTLSSELFGCCSEWKACDMGRKKCVWEDEDPEYAKLCACYRRHRMSPSSEQAQTAIRENLQPVSEQLEKEKEEEFVLIFQEDGQASLF